MVGSSPLARGTQDRVAGKQPRVRLIPARAGNTLVQMRARPHAPAHPRSRGEHTFTLDGAGGNRGSSPLARGTQSGTVRAAAGRRLIPARAGNTQNGLGAAKSISAHPRSRGEHPLIMVAAVAWFRLIPARAGNTWVRKALPGRGAAHPRSRGEHRCRSSASAGYVGSSPLARGTQEL